MMTVKPDAKILLVWIGRLGDLIVSTPFVRALRARYPRARITMLVRGYAKEAACMIAEVDEVKNISNPLTVLSLAFGHYDLCVDLNPSYSRTAGSYVRLSGAPVRVSFSKFRQDWFYTDTVAAPGEHEHMTQRYARLAEFFGAPFTPEMKLSVSSADMAAGKKLFDSLGLAGTAKVVIHPGNFRKFDHRWPQEKFIELTHRLLAKNIAVAYMCGPGEEKFVRPMAEKFGGKVPWVPPMRLGMTAGFMKNFDLLVVSATGTTHLAAATGTPVLSMNSQYSYECWRPLAGAGAHLTSGDWKTCHPITVDEVYDNVMRLLPAQK